MRKNIRYFGSIAPNPIEFQIQDRPRLITPEARETVLDFLLKNGKIAYINKVRFFLEDE
jgi:hypothetical protein